MNKSEEIQECIKNYVEQKTELQKQIVEIEEKRTQLAEKRNLLKKSFAESNEIVELGKEIAELGNQSQELQNKLDFMFYEIKPEVNFCIDNLIIEGIRQIRIISAEKKNLELENLIQEERQAKYELQKQEFYERFGRVPELSEKALEEAEKQKTRKNYNNERIYSINSKIDKIEVELSELANIKTEFKNKNWSAFIEDVAEPDIDFDNLEQFFAEEEVVLPLVEEIEPIEEIYIEELEVEPLKAIEEFVVEEFNPAEVIKIEAVEEKEPVDEMEKIARAIVEEIAAEQTKDIITFEEKAEEVKTPIVEEAITLSSIIAKIESGEIVYKAQISNGKEIKLYPTSQIIRDKEKRKDLKEILIKYAEVNDKFFDLKTINKIDPTVCELLILFANKYNYNPQSLIYDYAMSFSEYLEFEEKAILPAITYNFAYINGTYLSRKEKSIISKICKNANKNNQIDLIGTVGKFAKLKYILKRIFAGNKVNALPEAKY